jgi:hypothetical protein
MVANYVNTNHQHTGAGGGNQLIDPILKNKKPSKLYLDGFFILSKKKHFKIMALCICQLYL